jgi:hypothetical protein
MAKSKPSKIEIRCVTPGEIMTGANTLVLLDGQPVPMLTSVKFEVGIGNVAKVQLEMLAEVQLVGVIGKLDQRALQLSEIGPASRGADNRLPALPPSRGF